jgi:hypothetical protein
MKFKTLFAAVLATSPLVLAACSDSTGSSAPGQVQVRFGVASAASGGLALKAPAAAPLAAAVGGPLAVTGTNGSLSITGIQVVLDKFQLRGVHDQPCVGGVGSNDDSGNDDDAGECEFDAGPLFLDLPLDGSQLTVATGALPTGTYDNVRFRVKNLDSADDDAADDNDAAAEAALFQQVRAQFADWPAKASMRVTGTFTPTGGAARPFTAYLNAEVRLTLAISPPLTVTEGSATGQVSILLDPSVIFRTGSQVIDLSQFNGKLGQFEFRDGGFRGHGGHGGDD